MSVLKDDRYKARGHCLLALAVLLPLLVWPAGTVHAGSGPPPAHSNAPANTEILAVNQPQGTLVRAITLEPNSLDLPQTTETQASTTAWQMYDSLVWVDEEGKVGPALA